MSKIKEKILSLIKDLPEDTTSELEGLEDFKQERSYSLEEMKSLSGKWKLESQKRPNDS